MKKIVLLLLFAIITLFACSWKDEIIGKSLTDIHKQYTCVVSVNGLAAFQINGELIVVIANHSGIITRKASFAEDRKNTNVFGLALPKNSDLNQYTRATLAEVQKSFGDFHVDIGSGFSIPSYITADGYLICFWEENGVIVHLSKIDLFSGKKVEEKTIFADSRTGDGTLF